VCSRQSEKIQVREKIWCSAESQVTQVHSQDPGEAVKTQEIVRIYPEMSNEEIACRKTV